MLELAMIKLTALHLEVIYKSGGWGAAAEQEEEEAAAARLAPLARPLRWRQCGGVCACAR